MTSIADVEKAIADLGYGTWQYHEAMAMYAMTIARSEWRIAERIRTKERLSEIQNPRIKGKT